MPRAYSTDLRERALAACEAGEGSQSEIARRYRIGERTLSGWLKLAREEGRRAPKPRRGGTRPVGGEAATLAALVAERNDATLAEYADLLAERAGVRRSPSMEWTVPACCITVPGARDTTRGDRSWQRLRQSGWIWQRTGSRYTPQTPRAGRSCARSWRGARFSSSSPTCRRA